MGQGQIDYTPRYSHGGPNGASGGVTGAGNIINTYGAVHCANLAICVNDGGAVVALQCNNGLLDGNGIPPATEWIDISVTPGGTAFTSGQRALYAIAANRTALWRTVIVSIDAGASVTSCVPFIILANEQVASAKNPTVMSGGTANG